MSFVNLHDVDCSKISLGEPMVRFRFDNGQKSSFYHIPIKYEGLEYFSIVMPQTHTFGLHRGMSNNSYTFNLGFEPDCEHLEKLGEIESQINDLLAAMELPFELNNSVNLIRMGGRVKKPFIATKVIVNGRGEILSKFYQLGAAKLTPLKPSQIMGDAGQCVSMVTLDDVYVDPTVGHPSLTVKLYDADVAVEQKELKRLR